MFGAAKGADDVAGIAAKPWYGSFAGKLAAGLTLGTGSIIGLGAASGAGWFSKNADNTAQENEQRHEIDKIRELAKAEKDKEERAAARGESIPKALESPEAKITGWLGDNFEIILISGAGLFAALLVIGMVTRPRQGVAYAPAPMPVRGGGSIVGGDTLSSIIVSGLLLFLIYIISCRGL